MKKSESIAELAKALCKVQSDLRPALKDSNNLFFKSKYAGLASIWDAIRKPLADHGLCISQGSEPTADNRLRITTMLMHTSGEWLCSAFEVQLPRNDQQGLGSATSYLRRCSLAAIVGVTQEDDDGNLSSSTNADDKLRNEKQSRQNEKIENGKGLPSEGKRNDQNSLVTNRPGRGNDAQIVGARGSANQYGDKGSKAGEVKKEAAKEKETPNALDEQIKGNDVPPSGSNSGKPKQAITQVPGGARSKNVIAPKVADPTNQATPKTGKEEITERQGEPLPPIEDVPDAELKKYVSKCWPMKKMSNPIVHAKMMAAIHEIERRGSKIDRRGMPELVTPGEGSVQ